MKLTYTSCVWSWPSSVKLTCSDSAAVKNVSFGTGEIARSLVWIVVLCACSIGGSGISNFKCRTLNYCENERSNMWTWNVPKRKRLESDSNCRWSTLKKENFRRRSITISAWWRSFLSRGIIILLISFHVPFVVVDVVKGNFHKREGFCLLWVRPWKIFRELCLIKRKWKLDTTLIFS